MGAGEPGMLSPSPPTHGPLARAAEWDSHCDVLQVVRGDRQIQ